MSQKIKAKSVTSGDSVSNGLDSARISKRNPVKILAFQRAQFQGMHHCLILILETEPTHQILHVGTNDAIRFYMICQRNSEMLKKC